MSDDGDTKDDVRMPDGEVGEKINKLFKVDEKDTSEFPSLPPVFTQSPDNMQSSALPPHHVFEGGANIIFLTQTLSFSPPWVRRPLLRPRRLPASKWLLSDCVPGAPTLLAPQ
jgi:hypothetical protein